MFVGSNQVTDMSNLRYLAIFFAATFALAYAASPAFCQTTSFNYQGRLTEANSPPTGTYQMQFSLFNLLTGGTQIGTTITNNSVSVVDGVFSVSLSFTAANAFDGQGRWLEVAVKKPADPTYTVLAPRQMIRSSPYAIRSLSADTADDSLLFGGQPPSSYGTTGQITNLQTQITALQLQNTQLQAELAANEGGTQIWSKALGGSGYDSADAVAVDASGNVFVTGQFWGSVGFGGGTLVSAGSWDIFVAKYSGLTGAHLWSRRFGGAATEEGLGLAVDASGNVFVTGHYSSTAIDFGGGPLTNAGNTDIFLAKLSGSNGNHLWSRRFGNTGADESRATTVTPSGDVYISGSFSGTVDFGGLPLTSALGTDVFVAKYSGSTSTHVWSKRFGGTSSEEARSVAVDASGNVITAGYYSSSSIDFGGGALTNASPNYDGFLAKLASADGGHMWSKRFGGVSDDYGYGVAVDASGSPMVVGHFISGSIDLGGGPLVNSGSYDTFVVKYNSLGTHQWSKRVGGSSIDRGISIALDGAGNPVVVGRFAGSSSFGGIWLNDAGGDDVFAAKYSGANGLHQWSRRFGGTGFDSDGGVAVDSSGDLFVTGNFAAPTIDFGGGPLTSAGNDDIFVAKLRR